MKMDYFRIADNTPRALISLRGTAFPARESTYPVRRARSTGRCNTLLKFYWREFEILRLSAYRFFNSQIGPSLSSQTYPLAPRVFSDACDVANARVHTPSNSAGTHFSAGQGLHL